MLRQWSFFDSSGHHKIHSSFTPTMGGIAIFIGAGISLAMCLSFSELVALRFFLISIGIMFIIGLRDDALALTPLQKLTTQFLPIFILVFMEGTKIVSTYGAMGDYVFPDWLSILISIMVLVILTNAYNLIDGLDGLAGAIGFIILGFYGTWFYLTGHSDLASIALCFAGALIAFLFFNWQPSKIFMGDTGALTIGLLISYFTIHFIDINYHLPVGNAYRFNASITTALCIAIIPIFDTVRVIIIRLRNGQSPFKADKNHIHHQFLKLGFSHARSVLFIVVISIFFLTVALILRQQSDALIFAIVVAVSLVINYVLRNAHINRKVNHGTADQIDRR